VELVREPSLLWTPAYGHWFGLAPRDMVELTLDQYLGLHEFYQQATKDRK
jgi:hypothetical protein